MILSLFDRSGVMVKPWRDAGHRTLTVDIEAARHDGPSLQGDIRSLSLPQARIVFAFPPCTHLASSGARWWKGKGPQALAEALDMVDAARRASAGARWYLIENPVGRLATHWRPADWTFNPNDYAGYADDPSREAYTKRTCCWSNIERPEPRAVEPVSGSMMHRLSPSPDRAYLRSITPQGFARAIYQQLKEQP